MKLSLWKKNIDDLKLKVLLKGFKGTSIFKIIGLLSTRSILSLLTSIIIIYFIYSLLLLPAPAQWMALFKIEYENYSSSFMLNHFGNTLLSFCQIDSDFEIHPITFLGVVILIILKISILVLLFNFFINELKRKFKL